MVFKGNSEYLVDFHLMLGCALTISQVGPIPVDDGIGKEVATQIITNMETNKTFYTDSNGRDFIKRVSCMCIHYN